MKTNEAQNKLAPSLFTAGDMAVMFACMLAAVVLMVVI